MTVSTDNTALALPAPTEKDRPAKELAVAVIYGPLSDRLARGLVPLRIAPPAVVLANVWAGLMAAVAIAAGDLVLAAVLLQLKTVLDNADGRLARTTGKVTLLGRYLDTLGDLAVNAAVFAALGVLSGEAWLAVAAFLALTFVLTVDFNLTELHRVAHGRPGELPARSGTRIENALAGAYLALFAPQDRAVRRLAARRLERVLRAEVDPERRALATRAYHDRATLVVLANLGLSTQLAVLGICLVLARPEAYLWLALGSVAVLPILQARRERLARAALEEPQLTRRRAA